MAPKAKNDYRGAVRLPSGAMGHVVVAGGDYDALHGPGLVVIKPGRRTAAVTMPMAEAEALGKAWKELGESLVGKRLLLQSGLEGSPDPKRPEEGACTFIRPSSDLPNT